jgi:hypothetical protein
MIQLGRKYCTIFTLIFGTNERLIKMCLNKTDSKVRISKHLFDTFPIQNDLKQGDALSKLFFNFVF